MAYFHCLIGGGSSGGELMLTVTCDADFAGTTITCTDGVTTLTQTCPSSSPYEVVFEIPNGGDWTISGVVSGQTVTTGVNIPTTAELTAFVHKTITIYSATEDTVTYTDIYGDTQTEVFASGQSSKQITVDIEPSGSSITFTSGVAKNPTSLSSAYSKTVTITSNTTDVYLMPENTLYWWGYDSGDIEDVSTANGWSINQTNYDPVHNTNGISFSCGSVGTSLIGLKTTVKNKSFKFIGNQTGGGSLGYCATYRSSKSNADNVIVSNTLYTAMNTLELKTMPSQANDYYFTIGFISVNRTGNLNALWYE